MKTKHNPSIINAPDKENIPSPIENIDEDMQNEENTRSVVNHLHRQPILPSLSQETRKSNRVHLPTDDFLQSVSQEHLAFSDFLTQEHAMDYHIQKAMSDPIAYKSTTNLDTLYYHEAMAASDSNNFVDAIVTEINAY